MYVATKEKQKPKFYVSFFLSRTPKTSSATPAISVRGVRLQWVVFDAELPLPGTCLLGTRVGAVARVRLQVVEMERFGARVGQLTTRGPPFDGRLGVSGLVWDRSAAKAAEWSANLVSERAMLSQIDAYVGGDGGWASGVKLFSFQPSGEKCHQISHIYCSPPRHKTAMASSHRELQLVDFS